MGENVTFRGYNDLKRPTLEGLRDGKFSLSTELAAWLNLELTNACDVLWRLWKRKLVNRTTIMTGQKGRPRYTYTISDRGSRRLEYWERKAAQETER